LDDENRDLTLKAKEAKEALEKFYETYEATRGKEIESF
jgi:hypothetical protein